MAITKITNIGSSKSGGSSHLYNSINYIMNPEKTEQGVYISGNSGSDPKEVYKVMLDTKKEWGKTDKRQGYHMILSWEPGEATADQVNEILKEFCEEFLSDDYDYVTAVHTDQEHMHGHIVFNSVSRTSGYKFRYENGDWEKKMQPITDRLCEKHGLKKLEYDKEKKKGKSYAEYMADKKGKPNWSRIIRQDIDYIISCSEDYEDFISQMKNIGYKVKTKKYTTFIPPGGAKGRRDYKLGSGYSVSEIKQRIQIEKQHDHIQQLPPTITKTRYKLKDGYILSRYQMKKYIPWYRTRKYLNDKNPYAATASIRFQAIRISKLQEECHYLFQHHIKSEEQLQQKQILLLQKEKFLKQKRSGLYDQTKFPELETYQKIKMEMNRLPAESDQYEEMQENLYNIEANLPFHTLQAKVEIKDINEQLRELRKEKRIIQRIQSEAIPNKNKEKINHNHKVFDPDNTPRSVV